MSKTIIAATVVALLGWAGVSFARVSQQLQSTDYQCMSQCMSAGYMYGYCQKVCSY